MISAALCRLVAIPRDPGQCTTLIVLDPHDNVFPSVREVSLRFAPVKGERCHCCVDLDAGVCSSTCGDGGEDRCRRVTLLLLPVAHGVIVPARLTIHLFQFSFAVYVHSSNDAHRLVAKWVDLGNEHYFGQDLVRQCCVEADSGYPVPGRVEISELYDTQWCRLSAFP